MALSLTSAAGQISENNTGMLFFNSVSHIEQKRRTCEEDMFAANFHRLLVSTVTTREADIRETSVLAEIRAGILE